MLGTYALVVDGAMDVAYEAVGNGGGGACADNIGGCPFAKGGGDINEAMKSCMLGTALAAFEASPRLRSTKEARSSSGELLLRKWADHGKREVKVSWRCFEASVGRT